MPKDVDIEARGQGQKVKDQKVKEVQSSNQEILSHEAKAWAGG